MRTFLDSSSRSGIAVWIHQPESHSDRWPSIVHLLPALLAVSCPRIPGESRSWPLRHLRQYALHGEPLCQVLNGINNGTVLLPVLDGSLPLGGPIGQRASGPPKILSSFAACQEPRGDSRVVRDRFIVSGCELALSIVRIEEVRSSNLLSSTVVRHPGLRTGVFFFALNGPPWAPSCMQRLSCGNLVAAPISSSAIICACFF